MLLLQNGYTPLHIAARKNEIELAQLLLDENANAGALSKVCYTHQGRATRPVIVGPQCGRASGAPTRHRHCRPHCRSSVSADVVVRYFDVIFVGRQ